MIGTPNNLEILLHCHYCMDPHPRRHAPVVQEGIAFLNKQKMIYPVLEHGNDVYLTTAKGKAYIEYLLRVPFPEQHWIVPGDTRFPETLFS